MDSLNDIRKTWLRADTGSLPNTEKMLQFARNYQTKQAMKARGLMVLLMVLLATLIWVLVDYDSRLWSTKIGISLMFIALLIILYSTLRVFRRVRALPKYTNEAFLKYLKQEQIRLFIFQKRTQVIGFALASAGLLFYIFEIWYNNATQLTVAYFVTIAWIIGMWSFVRPYALRRKRKALAEAIEKLETVSAQLKR